MAVADPRYVQPSSDPASRLVVLWGAADEVCTLTKSLFSLAVAGVGSTRPITHNQIPVHPRWCVVCGPMITSITRDPLREAHLHRPINPTPVGSGRVMRRWGWSKGMQVVFSLAIKLTLLSYHPCADGGPEIERKPGIYNYCTTTYYT